MRAQGNFGVSYQKEILEVSHSSIQELFLVDVPLRFFCNLPFFFSDWDCCQDTFIRFVQLAKRMCSVSMYLDT